jgi:quercetin dioxygenase-like cupin family protein
MLISASAWSAEVQVVTNKPLPQFTDAQEVNVITVEYGPGESSPPHRHDAHTFVYVLEGSVVMQVQDAEPVTLNAGDNFYESPEDIHLMSKNASATESAKFLVFFIKPPGQPSTVPAN